MLELRTVTIPSHGAGHGTELLCPLKVLELLGGYVQCFLVRYLVRKLSSVVDFEFHFNRNAP